VNGYSVPDPNLQPVHNSLYDDDFHLKIGIPSASNLVWLLYFRLFDGSSTWSRLSVFSIDYSEYGILRHLQGVMCLRRELPEASYVTEPELLAPSKAEQDHAFCDRYDRRRNGWAGI
jgi:hypothetical protein